MSESKGVITIEIFFLKLSAVLPRGLSVLAKNENASYTSDNKTFGLKTPSPIKVIM